MKVAVKYEVELPRDYIIRAYQIKEQAKKSIQKEKVASFNPLQYLDHLSPRKPNKRPRVFWGPLQLWV